MTTFLAGVRVLLCGSCSRGGSFNNMVSALFGHQSLKAQSHQHEHERQHGEHPKTVEIGERGCLLLSQSLELLQSQLPGRHRVGHLLGKERLGVCDEGAHQSAAIADARAAAPAVGPPANGVHARPTPLRLRGLPRSDVMRWCPRARSSRHALVTCGVLNPIFLQPANRG